MSAYGKVAIVIGSRSDYDVVKPAVTVLDRFGVESEVRIISAHRTPVEAHDFAVNAEKRGFEVLIGVAGKAAHLAGVLAGYTTLPVIAASGSDELYGRTRQSAVHGADAERRTRRDGCRERCGQRGYTCGTDTCRQV